MVRMRMLPSKRSQIVKLARKIHLLPEKWHHGSRRYIGSRFQTIVNKKTVSLTFDSAMPYGGENKVTISCGDSSNFTLVLRLPEWADSYTFKINGEAPQKSIWKTAFLLPADLARRGYDWAMFCDTPAGCQGRSAVHEDFHKVAVQRSPLVYCMEECNDGKN